MTKADDEMNIADLPGTQREILRLYRLLPPEIKQMFYEMALEMNRENARKETTA